REIAKLGHHVRLIAPAYVKPFVWEFADRVHITHSVLAAQWKALVVPAPSRRLLRHTLLPLALTSSPTGSSSVSRAASHCLAAAPWHLGQCLEHQTAQAAARNTTPTGISPVMTKRHSAISSFRASATIIVVLRTPFGPSVRPRYH